MKLLTKFSYACASHPGWNDSKCVSVDEWRLFGWLLVWHRVRHSYGRGTDVSLRGQARLKLFQRPRS